MRSMSIGVTWTAYGRPAAVALHARAAAAKGGDPLRPVTIVVPTNSVGVSVRRQLASGVFGPLTGRGLGLAGVSLLTVYRLAELLGAPRLAAEGRRPVSTPVLVTVVRRALAEEPGAFAPVVAHPATAEALVAAHRELTFLPPGALARLEAGGRRAADVVRVHRRVRALLRPGWYDEADLLAAASQAVEEGAPVVADLGAVLVYLSQDLSEPAARLLRGLATRLPVEVVAGATGATDADAQAVRTLARLGATDEGATPPGSIVPPTGTRVVSLSDPDEEVRYAVRRVVAAARAGVPLERIALVYPADEPYARLCHEQLKAAGVAHNGAAVRPLADRLLGRWVLDLLDLPGRGYARQDVLDLLAAAPVWVGDRRAPVAYWERVSREAGVVAGVDQWRERLGRFAAGRTAEADLIEEAGDEGIEWRVRRLRAQAGDARGLARFVTGLAGEFERARGLARWRDVVAWLRALIARHLEPGREDWDEPERKAAERVEAALDRIAALDALGDRPDLGALRTTLELELDSDGARVGRFGDGVLVGPLSSALGVDLDLVIVLGGAEGLLPGRVADDSVLPDAERALAGGHLPLRGERVAVAHRGFLAALAASSGERVLCWPRGDLRRSVERPPSRWLQDTAAALQPDVPAAQRRVLPATAPWLHRSPSFAGALATLDFPATAQEYRLRALSEPAGAAPAAPAGTGAASGAPGAAGAVAAARALAEHPLVRADAALARGLALLWARRSAAFTRFDGNLSAVRDLLPAPTASATAPTRLELWVSCPLRYLLEHVLRVEVVENPEELVAISPLQVGLLIHEVLDQWLAARIAEGVPGPGEGWDAASRAHLAALAAEVCDRYEAEGVTGHPRLWQRDRERLLRRLARFADEDDAERGKRRLRPVATERAFGYDGGDLGLVEFPLGDGRVLRLRGKADRIDVADDGRVVVTDYKTGSARRYQALRDGQPVGDGTHLQLPVYALAARAATGTPDAPVHARYWFVSLSGRPESLGFDVDDAVLDGFREVFGRIVDGIEAGLFPARPPEPVWTPFVECPTCDPDALGTRERWKAWERKRDDPLLAGYLALVEPRPLVEVTW